MKKNSTQLNMALVDNCIKGKRRSQKELYEALAPQMFSICLKLLKNKADAEDVLQDGFIVLFKKLHQYRGEGPLEGWAKRIFVNTSISYLRAQKQASYPISEYEELVACRQKNALDNLYERDVAKITSSLSNGYKTVFQLYAVEGFSHKEVADIMGITESTSKSQFLRARASLRSSLADKMIA